MIRYLKNLAMILIGLVGWIFWCVVIFSCMITNNPIIIMDFNKIGEFMPELFFTIVLSQIFVVLFIDMIIHTKKYIVADILNKSTKKRKN